MPAVETLNCPMCGAPVQSDAANCQHCGARLATVACPSCFGLMFVGAKFCSHCGAAAARTEVPGTAHARCPRCELEMQQVEVGTTSLRECDRCHGVWVDKSTLEQICTNTEKQSALLGNAEPATVASEMEFEKSIRYLPCPICKQFMNRVQFANCSHVIVDVCKAHGTWFDKDELRRIIEFIRAGGMQMAREHEIKTLETRRERLLEEQRADRIPLPGTVQENQIFDLNDVLVAASNLWHWIKK